MCAGLAGLAVIWCILALLLGWIPAAGLVLVGLLALVAGRALWEERQSRRYAAWIASGEADRCLACLAGGLGHLAASIAARTRCPLALPLPGASLPRQRVEACLGLLSGTAEDVSGAVNRLGRACAGPLALPRARALLEDLEGALALARDELASLQALRARPEDQEGLRCLAGSFAGLLDQVGDWAALGTERLQEARARLAAGQSAWVRLPLELVPPPAFHGLQAWLRERGWQREESVPRQEHPCNGFSSGVLAGLVAGAVLGGRASRADPED